MKKIDKAVDKKEREREKEGRGKSGVIGLQPRLNPPPPKKKTEKNTTPVGKRKK